MAKIRVGVLGATGMVGQRFITLLENHPWFEVVAVAASPRSAGKPYSEAVAGRWYGDKWANYQKAAGDGKWEIGIPIPKAVAGLMVTDVSDISKMQGKVDLVFSALDMPKEEIRAVEDKYAAAEIAVVSNNSAHRWTKDVPMIVPEINPEHVALIDIQRKNRGWKKGLIAVKPNCAAQSYLPAIVPLMEFKPNKMIVTTMQAVSGAGKTLETFPEVVDSVIPLIKGEEEKSEQEPLKILGKIKDGGIENYSGLKISAHCNRVAATDGHMATVSVAFENKPTKEQILEAWKSYKPLPQQLKLPSAPDPMLIYTSDEARPQTKLDRDNGKGMAITIGRLRDCLVFDYRFVALSHNTVRGAAGGAILVAELLKQKGYI